MHSEVRQVQFLVDMQRQGCGQTVQKTVLVPQLQFIEGRRPPFVPQRQISMVLLVQKTTETPQLQLVRWSMPLLCSRSMPVVVPTGAHGSDTAENCGGRCSTFAVVDVALISFGHALVGDVPFFIKGSLRLHDWVTFLVGEGPDGLEAFDLEAVGRSEGLGIPSLHLGALWPR